MTEWEVSDSYVTVDGSTDNGSGGSDSGRQQWAVTVMAAVTVAVGVGM